MSINKFKTQKPYAIPFRFHSIYVMQGKKQLGRILVNDMELFRIKIKNKCLMLTCYS